jgi:arylsulfatase A-like enzyme
MMPLCRCGGIVTVVGDLKSSAQPHMYIYLSVSTYAHTQLRALDLDRPSLSDPWRKRIAAMAIMLDGFVATIMATLEEAGMLQDSIVIFASDNGAQVGALLYTVHCLYACTSVRTYISCMCIHISYISRQKDR